MIDIMSEWIKLRADDEHELDAYVARPVGVAVGALVLIQEIFGINAHVRRVAEGYANDGFLVIAPALFDRIERNVDLNYEGEDMQRAFSLYKKLIPETSLLDVAAAYKWAKKSEKGIGLLGYCYGGLMSWLAATRSGSLKIRPSCCVCYYPGGIGHFASEEPSCPVMVHIGAQDSHIGSDQIDTVRSNHPEVEIFVYEGADHAFNCDARASYHAPSAALARERTLAFLKRYVA